MTVRVYRGLGPLQQVVEIGRHRLLVDEPLDVGGEDSGPGPYGLLAAALATCTAMTVLMYARRKQMVLHDVEVQVDHAKSADGFVLQRRIRYVGELTEAEKIRLTEIAGRCPVHRTLEGSIRIETAAE